MKEDFIHPLLISLCTLAHALWPLERMCSVTVRWTMVHHLPSGARWLSSSSSDEELKAEFIHSPLPQWKFLPAGWGLLGGSLEDLDERPLPPGEVTVLPCSRSLSMVVTE